MLIVILLANSTCTVSLMGSVLPGKDKLHDGCVSGDRNTRDVTWHLTLLSTCTAVSPGWWVSGAVSSKTQPPPPPKTRRRHKILVGARKVSLQLDRWRFDLWWEQTLPVRAGCGGVSSRGPQLIPTSKGDIVRWLLHLAGTKQCAIRVHFVISMYRIHDGLTKVKTTSWKIPFALQNIVTFPS